MKKVTYSLEQHILVAVVWSEKIILEKKKKQTVNICCFKFLSILNVQSFNFICKGTVARD